MFFLQSSALQWYLFHEAMTQHSQLLRASSRRMRKNLRYIWPQWYVCCSAHANYHVILLWIGSHSFHAIALSVFGQSVGKFLRCARLGAVEHNDVLALVTNQQKIVNMLREKLFSHDYKYTQTVFGLTQLCHLVSRLCNLGYEAIKKSKVKVIKLFRDKRK